MCSFGMYPGTYPIDKLTQDLKPLLLGNEWQSTYRGLARILLYVWNSIGRNYSFPARNIFIEFKKCHPVIAKQLMRDHIRHNRHGFRESDFNNWIDYGKA